MDILHVHPKDKIIKDTKFTFIRRILTEIREYYVAISTIDPSYIAPDGQHHISNQILQKESIVIFC